MAAQLQQVQQAVQEQLVDAATSESLPIGAIPRFFSEVMYSLRFELVFAGFFLLSYAVAQIARSQGRKVPVATRPPQRSQENNNNRAPRSQQQREAPKQSSSVSQQRDAASAIAQGEIEAFRLKDASWIVPRLTQLCRWRAQRALEVYNSAVAAGLDLRKIPDGERDGLFMALVTALIRANMMDDATQLLSEVQNIGPVDSFLELCSSAVRLVTSKHQFQVGLDIHTLMKKSLVQKSPKPVDKSVWSCFLFCAIETKAYTRCGHFFEQLKTAGTPSQKDYWNMVRCGAVNGDWKTMLEIVREIRDQNLEVDNVIYNTVLATCVQADQIDVARVLLEEMDSSGCAGDVITYNTLMKGYGKRGDLDNCFDLYESMLSRGLKPSQVTYGILHDGCINNNQVVRAAKVFDLMRREGCAMNTVLYTTLIKGLAHEQKVDEAMTVFEQMRKEKEIAPDLITFSILLKANADAGRLDSALELVDTMLKMGVKPDEVIFNNLLSGCSKNGNADLAKRLYSDMVASGIKPSTATFSILIRVYSQCKLLDEAQNMLLAEPKKFNMEVEMRLFSQLIQACIRQRQGRRAIEIYEMMYSHCKPTIGMHNSVLGMCAKLNMFDTAMELLAVAAGKGAAARNSVDVRDANLVLEGAMRKRKDSALQSCIASMKTLGLAVDQSLLAQI